MIVAALLGLVGLVIAPVWVLRRVSPPSAFGGPAPPARRRAARAAARPETSNGRTRKASRAMLLLAVLLLAFAWALGEVIEEARIYAEVHAMPSNVVARQEPALRTVVLTCAGVLLVGAALLRSNLGSRRREA